MDFNTKEEIILKYLGFPAIGKMCGNVVTTFKKCKM